jgi:hypothetical protein
VTIQVGNLNQPPVAADDSYLVGSISSLAVSAPGVLANDVDPDGDTLWASLVSGPSHGSLLLRANGEFLYTPEEGYVGGDSFTYRTTDGLEQSGLARVSVHVLPPVSPLVDEPGDDGLDGDDESNPTDDFENGEDAGAEDLTEEGVDIWDLPNDEPHERRGRGPGRHGGPQAIGPSTPAAAAGDTGQAIDAMTNQGASFRIAVAIDTGRDVARGQEAGNEDLGTEDAGTEDLVWQHFSLLSEQLDVFKTNLEKDVASEHVFGTIVVGTSAISITGLTVGYVIWLIRSGSLLASVASMLTVLFAIDPLRELESSQSSENGHPDDDPYRSIWAGPFD